MSAPAPAAALPSIFISYARTDDTDGFVKSVYEALHTRGFRVWWDKVSMPSRGLTFLHEIASAIDGCDRVLVVLSDTAARSEYVRAEWQYALVSDKVVTPVLRQGEFALLPPELKGTHCEDVRPARDAREAIDAVLRLAAEPAPPLGSAVSVPVPPPHYRPRPDQMARVADRLALARPEQLAVPPQERAFLMYGMGGVGKSVLAAAVARSTATRRVFSDGVIWVALGPDVQPLAVLQQIALRLGGMGATQGTASALRDQIAERLAHAAVLIVLDNVSNPEVVDPVRGALGGRCRLMLTSRERTVVELGTPLVDLEPFAPDEALAYLSERARAAGAAITPAMADVARECGYLPFALALAGTMIRSTSWERLLERLKAADLSFMAAKIPGYPYTDLLRALQVSVDQLRGADDARGRAAAERYFEIAAFRWEAGVPESALATIWRARGGLDELAAEDVLTRLADHGLVRTEGLAPHRLVRLHDLQQDYLWTHVADRAHEHAALLDAYAHADARAPFLTTDDGYFLENCFFHLEQAGRAEQMHAVLDREADDGGNAWWTTRVAHGQVLGFVADVKRAWTDAWRAVSDGAPPDAFAVGRSVRYALMIGSARDAVRDVPLTLVRLLLADGIWTADQALALIEWSGYGARLIEALTVVFPHLTPERRPQALEDALQMARREPEDLDRARRLLQLAPICEGAMRRQVLDEALSLPGAAERVEWLAQAYQLAPERVDLLDRALVAARADLDPDSRASAVQALAAVLPPDRLEQLLPLLESTASVAQARSFLAIAERLPPPRQHDLARRALDVLVESEEPDDAAVLLCARLVRLLAPGDQARAATALLDEIDQLGSDGLRLALIADVAPFLDGIERARTERRAVDIAARLNATETARFLEEGDRGRWLSHQAPGLFAPLLDALLAVARNPTTGGRTAAVVALYPLLDANRRIELLRDELRRSQRIGDEEERALCIARLCTFDATARRAPHVTRLVQAMLEPPERSVSVPLLVALAPAGDADHLDRLAEALPRLDDVDRGQAAAALFEANARLGRWDEALDVLADAVDPNDLSLALAHLPADVPAQVARSIILAVNDTQEADINAAAIPPLVRYLPDDERPIVCGVGLQAARALRRRLHLRYQLLHQLIPMLGCDRLDAAADMIDGDDGGVAAQARDDALVSLAVRHAACGNVRPAFDALRRIRYAENRCRALLGIAEANLPNPSRQELLEAAEAAADATSSFTQVELLADVAHHAAPDRPRLLAKALVLARRLGDTSFYPAASARARALTSLAPMLEPAQRTEAILDAWREAARSGIDWRTRLEAVAPLVASLPPARIAGPWRQYLDGASGTRQAALETLRLMAPPTAALSGAEGIEQAIDAIEKVATWWP